MRVRAKELIVGMALCGMAMVSHGELVGEWLFNDGSGTDLENTAPTGSDYDGLIINGSQGDVEFVPGHDGTGTALDFGGLSGNSVTILDTGFLDTVSNEISISFWTLSSATQYLQTAAFQGSVGGTAGNREIQSHLPWNNGQVFWDCGYDRINNGGFADKADLLLESGEWVYWVFTKHASEGRQKVYANGKELFSGGGTQPIDGAGISSFRIGSKVDSTLTWPGAIDDFKVYDHELSAEEIGIGFDPNILSPVIVKTTAAGQSPLEVIFDGSETVAGQGVVDYLWDFGQDPSNVVIDATGAVVTNIFTAIEDVTTSTITLYVIDGIGATNSTTTTVKVVPQDDPHEVIDLVAVTNIPTSSEFFYETSITNLLTDPFNYSPTYPLEVTPNTSYQQGAHANDPNGSDVLCSFTNATPYTTVADYPVIVMDVWGRGGYTQRSQDFDVILYNGSWDEADKVEFGSVEGLAHPLSGTPYTRGVINTLPVGTTFDRVRIVGHNTSGQANNPFTLTEVRLTAVEGEVLTAVAKVSADPVSGYYPLEVAFEGTNSFTTTGTITDYLWDFGDGNSDSGVDTAMNTYAEAGLFTNTLTIINSVNETNSAQVVIDAMNPILVDIAATNTAPAGVSIDFDGSASSNAVGATLTSYTWTFDDGTMDTGEVVSKAFGTGGTHTATLTITDDEGRTNSASVEVEILAAHVLSLDGTTLSWDTANENTYEVQYSLNLSVDGWVTYTNVTGTPPETSVEIPVGRDSVEFYQVLMH